RDLHIQIARRPAVLARLAFAAEADTIAVIHPGRHLDRQRLGLLHPTPATAGATRIGNDGAATMTTRACLLDGEESLLYAYIPVTMTSRTGFRLAAILDAAAPARLAYHPSRHLDLYLGTAYRFLQGQIQRIAQVCAAEYLRAASTARCPENVSEHIGENVGEVTRPSASGAHRRIDTSMAELVVSGPLLWIREHLISVLHFLEVLLG